MNRAFDYRGVQVAPSHPVAKLRTITKTVYIDSGDRDVVKYPRNGDFVVYLPRSYEKVVSLRVKSGEFPLIAGGTGSVQSYTMTTKASANLSADPLYFFIDVEGLNRADETAVLANGSSHADTVFAKIQIPSATTRVIYSEDTGPKNINTYTPALGRLDRLHIRTRLHTDTSNSYIYWPSADYGLTVEIEMLDNSFDEYSALETRLVDRS
jgi:hypothetical protein